MASDNQVAEEAINCIYTALEDLMHGANSSIATVLNNYLDNVTTSSATVNELILIIYCHAINSSLNLTELDVEL